jgi:serine/threonine protein kinase/HEAT repeat protein
VSKLSVPGLIGLLRDLSLLETAALQELPRYLATGRDVPWLLEELQRRQWLTPWQVKVLLAGDSRDLVLGPYLLLDLLGQGAMGRVYRARHQQTGNVVALKVIPAETMQSQRQARRFQREVFVAAQLRHPNIVAAYEAGQAGQAYYMVMEYIDGIDLSRLVKQNGPFPLPLACDLIRQAALALQYAHDQDLIHRDVKPSNLMVVRAADRPPLVKVLDFGLARFLTEADGQGRLTHVGGMVGTVDYISPEQATNARVADARSDVFSLGATLFYILTGMPPYSGKDIVEKITARVRGAALRLSAYRGNVSPGLEAVVATMLAREPMHRYPTARQAAAALAPFCRLELARLASPPAAALPAPVVAAVPVAVEPSPVPQDAALPLLPPPSWTDAPPLARAKPQTHRVVSWKVVLSIGATLALLVGLGLLAGWQLRDRPPPRSRPRTARTAPNKTVETPLDRVQRELGSERAETRRSAVLELEKMKPDEARPALPALLLQISREKETHVRRAMVRAVSALARPEDDQAIATLAKLVDDSDTETGEMAARAIARLTPERAMATAKVLGRLLTSGTDSERRAALQTLSRLGETAGQAAPELGQALSDKLPEVRRGAAFLLGRLGEKASPAVPALALALEEKEEVLGVRLAVVEALVALRFPTNEKAVPPLLRIIRADSQPVIRQRSIRALFSVPDLDAIHATRTLEELLQSTDGDSLLVRYDAARLLAQNQGAKASDRIVAVLLDMMRNNKVKASRFTSAAAGDVEQDARFMAVAPLARTITPARRERIRKALVEASREKDARLRRAALEELDGLP